MAALVDALSFIALVAGGAFYVIGAIGLNRMPDVFTRMHAVSVGDTLGLGLIVIGLLLQAGPSLVAVKLVFIALGLWTAGAVATHALARAALHAGERPLLADAEGRLVPTDPVALFPELAVRLAEPVVSEVVEEEPAAEAAPETVPDEEARSAAQSKVPANPDAEPPPDAGPERGRGG